MTLESFLESASYTPKGSLVHGMGLRDVVLVRLCSVSFFCCVSMVYRNVEHRLYIPLNRHKHVWWAAPCVVRRKQHY